jgi:hypothetical protein
VLGYADHQLDRQFNQASAVLALARQQLKQTNRARATLSTGELMLQSQTNDLGPAWKEVVAAHVLTQEAKRLIEGPVPAK